MKKLLLLITLLITSTIIASPGRGFRPPPGRPPHGPRPIYGPRIPHRPPPPPPRYHHRMDWRTGSSFITGLAVGSIIYDCIKPSPVVITQPVVTTPTPIIVDQTTTIVSQPIRVWVDGRYVDQLQSNGTMIRTWIPGHWEYR